MTAPHKVITPPSAQTDMKSARLGSAAATDPGVRRIPPPIVAPTTIASPNALPSTRSRDGLPGMSGGVAARVAAAGPLIRLRQLRSEMAHPCCLPHRNVPGKGYSACTNIRLEERIATSPRGHREVTDSRKTPAAAGCRLE